MKPIDNRKRINRMNGENDIRMISNGRYDLI